MKKKVYCDKEKKETDHTISIDKNGETVFECETKDCGSFVKFPKSFSVEQIKAGLARHKDNNNTGKQDPSEEEKNLHAFREQRMKDFEQFL